MTLLSPWLTARLCVCRLWGRIYGDCDERKAGGQEVSGILHKVSLETKNRKLKQIKKQKQRGNSVTKSVTKHA